MGKLILGTTSGTSTAWQIIGRMIAAAVVLAITAFFTPGFTINNIWSLVIAAIVLTILDYLIVKLTNLHASPFGKGFVGFILSAVILYVTQFFVIIMCLTLLLFMVLLII